jgi:ATP-dependent Clp protease ATP-binding subunit ClpC
MSDEPMNNFTPRAQQVLALARKEADRFNHSFVGTEHLLLGLINLGQGVAVNVLQKMGLNLETVRLEVEKQVGTGPDQKLAGNIPYTPRVKKVLELSKKEAKALHHTYVGTEHILLGLLREGEGVAARVLKTLDIDIDLCRQKILHELDPNFEGDAGDAGVAAGMEEEEHQRSRRSVATSPRSPKKARWIRSSAAPRRSSASSKCSAAVPRTTQCCSARPASARQPSSRA